MGIAKVARIAKCKSKRLPAGMRWVWARPCCMHSPERPRRRSAINLICAIIRQGFLAKQGNNDF